MSKRHWLCAASVLALSATLTPSVQAACPAPGTPNITFSGDAACVPATATSGDLLNAGASAPGAAGSVSVTGGATVTLQSGSGAAATPIVQIGRQPGSVGNLTVSGAGSALELDGGGKTGNAAQVRIGFQGGTGSATVAAGGALRVLDPTAPAGSSGAAGDSIAVGQTGGTGSLTLNSGSLTIDTGSGAFLRVGDRGGTGTLTVSNGSTITVRDRDPTTAGDANFSIGRDLVAAPASTATTGTATISGSTVSIQSDGGFAGLLVGREAGTTGVATISNSSVSIVSNRNTPGPSGNAGILVGRDGPSGSRPASDGTLTITNSTVTVSQTGTAAAAGASAFMNIGETGTGRVTLQGAGTTATFTGPDAVANVGRNAGADGTLTVRDNATLSMNATAFNAGIFVGRLGGASGSMTIANGAAVTLNAPDAIAFLQVAREAGSLGTMQVTGGSSLTLNGGTDGAIVVGRNAGALGSLTVSGGSQIFVTGIASQVRVGGTDPVQLAAGAGTLTISGLGSLVSADRVVVGAPVSLAGSTSDGGTVIVSNGGTLQAGEVRIGTAGLVGGSGGTIIGSVILDGGTLAPGASPGTLNILGNLTVLDGILKIEIGGTGAGQYDVLNVSGTTMIAGGTVLFEFIDGFAPTAGQTFNFFSGPNAPVVDPGVTFAVGGLQAGFQFDLSGPALTFVALTDGVSTTVPEPASAALLLAGLLGLAALRRRAA
jgi:T5SS/PEP-CTERM-associated repeat protein